MDPSLHTDKPLDTTEITAPSLHVVTAGVEDSGKNLRALSRANARRALQTPQVTSSSSQAAKDSTSISSAGQQAVTLQALRPLLRKSAFRNESSSLQQTKLATPQEALQDNLKLVRNIREKNIGSVNQFRAQSRGVGQTTGELDVGKIVDELPKIKKLIEKKLPKFTKAAAASATGDAHFAKGTIKKLEYAFTVTNAGQIFVHVPESSFARGGQKEIKAAVDVTIGKVVVRSVQTKGSQENSDSLKTVRGDLLVKEKCGAHENIGSVHAVTNFASKDANRAGTSVVMEFLRGGDLAGKVFQREEFLKHAIGAARGLEKMHEAGLANRDVKPENMMLDESGTVKIVDFGTVVEAPAKESLTKSDKALKNFTRDSSGTPQYKPPECSTASYFGLPISEFERSRPLEFVQRGDVYGLGVSLYEMQNVIQGNTLDERGQNLLDQIASFKKSTPNDPINQFILRMLDDDPAKRPTIQKFVNFLKSKGRRRDVNYLVVNVVLSRKRSII